MSFFAWRHRRRPSWCSFRLWVVGTLPQPENVSGNGDESQEAEQAGLERVASEMGLAWAWIPNLL